MSTTEEKTFTAEEFITELTEGPWTKGYGQMRRTDQETGHKSHCCIAVMAELAGADYEANDGWPTNRDAVELIARTFPWLPALPSPVKPHSDYDKAFSKLSSANDTGEGWPVETIRELADRAS